MDSNLVAQGSWRGRGRLLLGLAAAALVLFTVVRFVVFSAEPTRVPATASERSLSARTAALEDRVRTNGSDVGAWRELAVTYTGRAVAEGDPSFYELAQRALERAEELDAQAPATILARGHLELSLHRFSDARATGERLVELVPANADALGILVDAQVELGDYAAAADTLQRMLDVDPGLPALARASYLRELHGDRAGAITAMQQAELAGSALAYDRATVATLLGDLLRQDGRLDAADEAYGRALAAVEGHVPAQLGQLRIAATRGGVAGVIPEVRTLVERVPRLDAVLVLAELTHADGDTVGTASALELARTLTTLQRDAGQVVDLELAQLEADLGDAAAAVDLAQDAYEARPDNVHAADTLAWSLHRAGRSDEAVAYLEQALRLGTVDPRIRLHAAAILTATGDTDAASAHLRSVAASDPWVSFALLDDAARLAEELGVAAPDAWSRR